MTASIIAFPLMNAFSRSDRAELSRWAAAAAQHRWFLKAALEQGGGGWIAIDAEGREHVAIAYGQFASPADFLVQRRQNRWEIRASDGAMEGVFRTLRLALETICPTLPATAHVSEKAPAPVTALTPLIPQGSAEERTARADRRR